MKELAVSALRRLHRALLHLGVEILLRRVLIPIMLVTVYLLPLGLTSILVRLLRPSLLHNPPSAPGSYWHKATGYQNNREKLLRQS